MQNSRPQDHLSHAPRVFFFFENSRFLLLPFTREKQQKEKPTYPNSLPNTSTGFVPLGSSFWVFLGSGVQNNIALHPFLVFGGLFKAKQKLGGGFQYVFMTWGKCMEMIQFDLCMFFFLMGWFNHYLLGVLGCPHRKLVYFAYLPDVYPTYLSSGWNKPPWDPKTMKHEGFGGPPVFFLTRLLIIKTDL